MRIDGSTSSSDRHANVKRFQEDSSIRVALLGVTSAGQGITLTAASTVVFAELHWTPGVLVQAEDRAHRIGQKAGAVNVLYLCADGTIDDVLWPLICRKVATVSHAVDGERVKLNAAVVRPVAKKISAGTFAASSFELTSHAAASDAAAVAASDGVSDTPLPTGDIRGFFRNGTLRKKPRLDRSASGSAALPARRLSVGTTCSPCQSATTPAPSKKAHSGVLMDAEDDEATSEDRPWPTPLSQPTTREWACLVCTLLNSEGNALCAACGVRRGHAELPSSETQGRGPAGEKRKRGADKFETSPLISLLSDEEADDEPDDELEWNESSIADDTKSTEKAPSAAAAEERSKVSLLRPQKAKRLFFSVSANTGRYFLFNDSKASLDCNIHPDVIRGVPRGAEAWPSTVPSEILSDEAALDEIRKFATSWESLRAVERKVLCGKVLRPPLMRHVAAARISGGAKDQPIFDRYLSRDPKSKSNNDAASCSNVSGAKNASGKSVAGPDGSLLKRIEGVQDREQKLKSKLKAPAHASAVGNGNVPLCVACGKEIDAELASARLQYCGKECAQSHALKLNGSAVRRQLFELEHGVCQLCGFDAHGLWRRLSAVTAPERLQLLMGTRFKTTKGLLKDPKEGDFWQADHIVPVSEGGGQCSLHNFRTLCTPCHAKETASLHHRLKLKRGCGAKQDKDIRSFFRSVSGSSSSS